MPDPRARIRSPGRLLRHAIRVLAWLLVGIAFTLLLAWIVGRLASDRWSWSQWLFWAVAPAGSVPSGIALLLAAGFLRLARSGRPAFLLAIAFALIAWTPVVGWRLWVWPLRALQGPPEHSLRLAHWNPAAKRADFTATLHPLEADIVVISNPPHGADTRPSPTPDDFPYAVALPLGRVHARDPIQRWGSVWLGLSDLYQEREREWHEQPQSGWAAFIEIDTTEALGRPIVVWILDLPSSPEVSRREVALRTRRAIETWGGPSLRFEARSDGERLGITQDPVGDPGFPPPDVIVGDFNTPRGAWSASQIAAPLTTAFGDLGSGGGVGRCVTWPRDRPLYQLDQTFLGDWLRSCRYWVVDPGTTPHRIQVVDLRARK